MDAWIMILGWLETLTLIVLIGLSIWSVAIMIDRHKVFKELQEKNSLMEVKTKLLQDANSVQGNTLFSKTIQVALSVENPTTEKVEKAVKGFLSEQKNELEKGLTVLATLGSNAPFIGLFGTVLGIIQAFAALGGQSTSGGSTIMSAISFALIATAAGLFVAIPAVVGYNVYSRKLKLLLSECEILRDLLIAHGMKGKL